MLQNVQLPACMTNLRFCSHAKKLYSKSSPLFNCQCSIIDYFVLGTRSSIHVNLYVPTLIGGIGKSYWTQPAVILIRYSAQKQHRCFLLSVTGLLITIVRCME